MSDASLIAGELQDLASAIENVAAAVKATPPTVVEREAAPPVVNIDVHVPEQAAPSVNVEVNVPEAPPAPVEVQVAAPNVTVQPNIVLPATKPNAYEVRITERDADGFISAFTIRPLPR